MGSEDWVLKRTKLITNTKKQILQVYSKGQSLPNTVLKKKKKTKSQKMIKYMYEVCFKNRVFFWKGNSRLYKLKLKK